MKRNTAIALLSFATLAGIGSASAQNQAVQATVPFDFTVGGRLLPADTYKVTAPSAGLVMIQGSDKHVAVLTATLPANNDGRSSKLVFDKYGDQYFLHEVRCSSVSMNVRIPTSNQEKRVQLQEAKLAGGEPVLIAAR